MTAPATIDPELAQLLAEASARLADPAVAEARLRDEAVEARRRTESALERAFESVPASYRWACQKRVETAIAGPRVAVPDLERVLSRFWRLPWVVIMGAAGSGKTSLACMMLGRAVETAIDEGRNPGSVCFAHAFRLGTARIQARAGDGEPEPVYRAMHARWCILDDLGAERDTANNAVPDVIFERHAEARQLWITTGLTREAIAQRYGDGIVRRIFERASVVQLGSKRNGG